MDGHGKFLILDCLKQSYMDFRFTFLSHWKTSDSHLILQDFHKKMILLRNCVKNHHSISYVESPIFEETDHLCFYKNLANQAVSFISSQIVYFRKHLAYQVQDPWETKFLLPLNAPYHRQTIKLVVGTIAEPIHSLLKDVFRKLLFGCIWKEN